MILSRKNLKIITILSCLSILFLLFQKKSFESSISIYPSYGGSDNSSLLDLASNFGIGKSLNASDPVIYTPDIINSFTLKNKILSSSYKSLESETLFEHWKSKKILSSLRTFEKEKLIYSFSLKLDDQIKVNINRVSGMIVIKTYFESTALSQEVNNLIYQYLIDFINKSSSDDAKNKFNYLTKRSDELQLELNSAENDLKEFLIINKDIKSPLLQTEYLRLMRNIELKNQSYTMLRLEIENEKINLNKNELNFIISDKYNNPKPVKVSVFEMLFLNIVLFLGYLFFNKNKRNLFRFFSN